MTREPTPAVPALPKAILLDLDDTIISAHGNRGDDWRQVLAGFEGHEAIGDYERLHDNVLAVAQWFWSDTDRHRIGRQDIRKARRDIVARAFAQIELDHDELCHTIADAFSDHREAAMQLFPGALDAIDRLRAAGVALALVTNGGAQGQRAKIERFDLAHRFDHILIEGEFGKGKPEPEVYLYLMERLQSGPDTTWVVGDNLEWEVAAPSASASTPSGAIPTPRACPRAARSSRTELSRACRNCWNRWPTSPELPVPANPP